MNELKRMQHKYKVTSADFLNIKVTGTAGKKENPLIMTLVSIGLATTILTPLLSIL
ncbi:hypothetical protein XNC1_3096 [Xenorhabdus nematophila ATCC 19061]|uniref:Uncharacterized protein n=1 Tax=Xenorhabdus nematophila (strain ATCC 19061 / DSM 3370 / CCUG 14189 / LMG 1036 / NCIMB 9965 / AN6) TaxID=406817 RepID=D3VKP2_XENNA|nr:hypothetical protein [Xenorhabdus nematophila]CBJ91150.1 hypothetical protein XNC1_3096 [Xenorhabdus nematophila ATCC 19061]